MKQIDFLDKWLYRMHHEDHDEFEADLEEVCEGIAREQWSLDIRKVRKFGGLKELKKIELVTEKK